MAVTATKIADNIVCFRINVDAAGTAEQVDDGTYGFAHEIWVSAPAGNTGITYIGGSVADQTSIGFPLAATGESIGPIRSANGIRLSELFIDSDTNDDDVSILAILQN